jgi:uncharacterized membrane protein
MIPQELGADFPQVIIFAGAMLGFTFARLSYLNVGGSAPSSYRNSATAGEWFHVRDGYRRIGFTLHIATCLPLGFLMVWQFVPVIRHKFLTFHRINGYVIMLLIFFTNIGALMIAQVAFGGTLDIQAIVGLLAILTIASAGMAYYNVKRLQIDQHRAWMLRCMFYLGTIITTRIIMIISALTITKIGGYYALQSCDQIAAGYDSILVSEIKYPRCANAAGNTLVLVQASFTSQESVQAALGLSFGMALWLATFIHLVGVEIYLGLTPAEGERLRNVSYERQLEAGFTNPGSAGLTSDRWGDASKWEPKSKTAESLHEVNSKV